MLRLYDMRTRQAESIRPAYGGELRVLAVTPEVRDEPNLGQLRGWLLTDLIRRCAEHRGLVVTTCEIAGPASQANSGSQPPAEGLGPLGEALNIYPPARTAPAGEPIERTVEFVAPGSTGPAPGGPPPFDVGTGDGEWLTGLDLTRYVAAPAGAVTFDGQKVPAGAPQPGAPSLDDVAARGLDPLAVRLAMLGRRYRDDLDLTWDALEQAGQTLRRWRKRVAGWAFSPSAAMLRGYADAITGAFEDDLDTPTALRELRVMEADEGAPAGARFETFASMDRLLGLDLARDIGKVVLLQGENPPWNPRCYSRGTIPLGTPCDAHAEVRAVHRPLAGPSARARWAGTSMPPYHASASRRQNRPLARAVGPGSRPVAQAVIVTVRLAGAPGPGLTAGRPGSHRDRPAGRSPWPRAHGR